MRQVQPTLEDGLRALREATELAQSITIELDEAYLADISRVEARPENLVSRTRRDAASTHHSDPRQSAGGSHAGHGGL